MIVDGNGEYFLGTLLANDVLIEYGLDLLWFRQLVTAVVGTIVELFANNVITEFDTFITNEYGPAISLRTSC